MAFVVSLLFLALPSLGITSSLMTAAGGESQTSAEEIHEFFGVRKVELRSPQCRHLGINADIVWRTDNKAALVEPGRLRSVQGHRFSNGLLAPIRC